LNLGFIGDDWEGGGWEGEGATRLECYLEGLMKPLRRALATHKHHPGMLVPSVFLEMRRGMQNNWESQLHLVCTIPLFCSAVANTPRRGLKMIIVHTQIYSRGIFLSLISAISTRSSTNCLSLILCLSANTYPSPARCPPSRQTCKRSDFEILFFGDTLASCWSSQKRPAVASAASTFGGFLLKVLLKATHVIFCLWDCKILNIRITMILTIHRWNAC